MLQPQSIMHKLTRLQTRLRRRRHNDVVHCESYWPDWVITSVTPHSPCSADVYHL